LKIKEEKIIKVYRLADSDLWHQINKDFNTKGGVYRLIYQENNYPKPIGRFLGINTGGILYIGKANSFLDRVINLKKTIAPDFFSSSTFVEEGIRKIHVLQNFFLIKICMLN